LPEIGRIQSTNFQSLLTELGITRNNIPFALRSEVTPVVLVGGTVSFLAAPTPPYAVTDIFTGGILTQPAAGAVLADTGPLPIGAYSLQFTWFCTEFANIDIQWRDAANGANLWVQRFRSEQASGGRNPIWQTRLNILNDNERVRIVNVALGAAAQDYQVTILMAT